MTTPRQLSVTNYQLAVIHTAARLVPLDWRSRFLEAVADRLLPLDIEQITDAFVNEAVRLVLAQMHVPAIEPSCVGDRV